MAKKPVHFDWAMKKMLLDKANFDILEGIATWGESLTHKTNTRRHVAHTTILGDHQSVK